MNASALFNPDPLCHIGASRVCRSPSWSHGQGPHGQSSDESHIPSNILLCYYSEWTAHSLACQSPRTPNSLCVSTATWKYELLFLETFFSIMIFEKVFSSTFGSRFKHRLFIFYVQRLIWLIRAVSIHITLGISVPMSILLISVIYNKYSFFLSHNDIPDGFPHHL